MNKTSAPMIVLFTDFGSDGPYVGQMKAVLAQQAPDVPVIDLLHSAPCFNPRAAAHLLAAYVSPFPAGSVILAVVDPGVGDEQRKPVIMCIEGRWYVGPGNGLFDVLAARAVLAGQAVECWEVTWRPENLSSSFHGRDLFAPVAARLAKGETPPGESLEWPLVASAADDLLEVIYIDHFGNAMIGLRADKLSERAKVELSGQTLSYARTFSEMPTGQMFWYKNANGLVEVSINQGCAACELGLSVGVNIAISN